MVWTQPSGYGARAAGTRGGAAALCRSCGSWSLSYWLPRWWAAVAIRGRKAIRARPDLLAPKAIQARLAPTSASGSFDRPVTRRTAPCNAMLTRCFWRRIAGQDGMQRSRLPNDRQHVAARCQPI